MSRAITIKLGRVEPRFIYNPAPTPSESSASSSSSSEAAEALPFLTRRPIIIWGSAIFRRYWPGTGPITFELPAMRPRDPQFALVTRRDHTDSTRVRKLQKIVQLSTTGPTLVDMTFTLPMTGSRTQQLEGAGSAWERYDEYDGGSADPVDISPESFED